MKYLRGYTDFPKGTAVVLAAAAICALAILGMGIYVEQLKSEQLRAAERARVVDQLASIRTRLEGTINDSIGRLEGVTAYIERTPDLTEEEFAFFASKLITGRTHIRNIAAAPDLVVRYVYPVEGNESVIGLDYRRTPAQWQAARRALETGRVSLAGPVNLVQGGTAFIARAPVFVDRPDNSFWGLVSTVVDTDVVYTAAGLFNPALEIEVVIRGKDALGRSGEVFFGDVSKLGADPVELGVAVPNGKWLLIATPKAGWYARGVWDHREVFIAAGFSTLLMLLSVAFVYLRRTRKLLNRRLENLSRAVDQSSNGLVIASARGLINYANPRFLAMSQRTEADTIGSHVRGLFNEGELDLGFPAVWRSVLAGNNWQNEQQNWRMDGTPYWESVAITPLKDDDGNPSDVLIVINDITEQKGTEEVLMRAKLGAEAANRAKSQFLASMSHELRTPLNAILGFAQMLELNIDKSLSERHNSYVGNIVSAGRHLLELVNDILDLARVEADRMPLELEIIDLNEIVRESVALTRTTAEARQIDIHDMISAGPAVTVAADQLRLKQVLLNLLSNAVKYNRDEGRVDVTCSGLGTDTIRISVADTGLGIAEQDGKTVFEMFKRLHSDPMLAQDGTGIGLTVSKILVERMNGRIGFDSEPGKGSTFWLELPVSLTGAPGEPANETSLDAVVAINDLSENRRRRAG